MASRLFTAALGVATLLNGATADQQNPLTTYTCEHPPYTAQLVSRCPLVIYLEGFLTPAERQHLQQSTKDTFSHSGVASQGGKALHSVRTSQSTTAPRDAVTRCIEDRALHFQGHDTPRAHLEPLQLVKYARGQRYHFHTDWFTHEADAPAAAGGNRASSFFAYVRVGNDTLGGGTNFPLLDVPADPRWCRVLDCDEPWERGVTFRPVEGNAVYWENLLPDGNGDPRTLHAGLGVARGDKIGMNIWTRQAPLSAEVRGHDLE